MTSSEGLLFKSSKPIKLFPLHSTIFFCVFLIFGAGIWFSGMNHDLFMIINQQHNLLPYQAWSLISLVTYSKFFIAPGLLLLFALLFRRDKLLNVILLIGAYFIVFMALKHMVGEARPYITLADGSFFWLNKYEDAVKSAYLSFPSGHTGNVAIFAFGMNYLFFANNKPMQFIMLLLVIVTGIARICTGWHWPLDVLASGLIGYLLVKIIFSFDVKQLLGKRSANARY